MSSLTGKIKRYLLIVVFGITGMAGLLVPQARRISYILAGAGRPLPKTSGTGYGAALPASPLTGLTWVRTGGPMGGRGYDIRMRPDNPDILYVTDQFAGIHKSTDGGHTWFAINEGIDARTGSSGDAIPTFCLTVDPNNYDIIWAGTFGFRGAYRSADGGNTWEKRTNGIVEGTELTFRGFSIEPGNSNVVYAAGEIGVGPGFNASRSKGVVYKTIDGGLNWRAIWRGDSLTRYVLIDPTNVNTLYVSTGIWDREAVNSDGAANIAGGVGILKSTDGGTTWRQINNGLNNLYIGSLFMHPANPRILLAGAGSGVNASVFLAGSGVYLTTDAGEHWTQVLSTGDTLEHITPITSVEISTKDPNVAYAGGLGFWRSEDGGWNWTRYTPASGFFGPAGIRNGVVIDFQADPRGARRLFSNNYNGGNIMSEDGGNTWQSATTGYTGAEVDSLTVYSQNPTVVYAAEKGNPYVSDNGGRHWRGINNVIDPYPVADCQTIVIDPSDPNHLLMSGRCDASAYESHNRGNTWYITADYRVEMRTRHPGASESFWAMAFAPSQPNRVYGTFGATVCGALSVEQMNKTSIISLLISEDGGHTWNRREGTALDGLSVTDVVVHPTNANTAWVSTAGGGVFRTSDGGTTWQPISNGLGSLVVASVAINPRNLNEMYATTPDSGVFKTDDGGATWRQTITGMNPNESVADLVIDPVRPNVVYAASQTSGVFVSEDAGASWHLINNGLRTRAVRSLAISSDGKVLYAGTIGEGVYRLGGEPGAAKLVAPFGDISTNKPSYTWNAVTGATYYQLWVNDSTHSPTITEWYTAEQAGCSSGTGNCSISPSTALAPGAAKWWVQTWNDFGYGPWSDSMSFTVSAACSAPGKATLISPAGDIATAHPTYTWNAVPPATWYYLWVSDSTAAGKIKQWYTAAQAGCQSGNGICSITPSTALSQGGAQWWIQTWNECGGSSYGPWSDVRSFFVSSSSGNPPR